MHRFIFVVLILALLIVGLSGCASKSSAAEPTQPILPAMRADINALEKALATLNSLVDELKARILVLEGSQP